MPTVRQRTTQYLWEFLLELLDGEESCPAISWLNREEGEFVLKNQSVIAKLWGKVKGRPHMDKIKLGRAMRYYYKKKLLAKVPKRKAVYRFVKLDYLNQAVPEGINYIPEINFSEVNTGDFIDDTDTGSLSSFDDDGGIDIPLENMLVDKYDNSLIKDCQIFQNIIESNEKCRKYIQGQKSCKKLLPIESSDKSSNQSEKLQQIIPMESRDDYKTILQDPKFQKSLPTVSRDYYEINIERENFQRRITTESSNKYETNLQDPKFQKILPIESRGHYERDIERQTFQRRITTESGDKYETNLQDRKFRKVLPTESRDHYETNIERQTFQRRFTTESRNKYDTNLGQKFQNMIPMETNFQDFTKTFYSMGADTFNSEYELDTNGIGYSGIYKESSQTTDISSEVDLETITHSSTSLASCNEISTTQPSTTTDYFTSLLVKSMLLCDNIDTTEQTCRSLNETNIQQDFYGYDVIPNSSTMFNNIIKSDNNQTTTYNNDMDFTLNALKEFEKIAMLNSFVHI